MNNKHEIFLELRDLIKNRNMITSDLCNQFLIDKFHNDFGSHCFCCEKSKIDILNRYQFYCRCCQRFYTPKYNTVIYGSKVRIVTWFHMIHIQMFKEDMYITSFAQDQIICFRSARNLMKKVKAIIDIEKEEIDFLCKIR